MTTANATIVRFALNTWQWPFAPNGRRGICYLLFAALLFLFLPAGAQQPPAPYEVRTIAVTPVKSIRGLSAVTDNIVWASGTGGQVGISTDGGEHWQWHIVPGCDSCDWRSLYAFDARKAIVLNAGEPALIFLTVDGGTSWTQVFRDDRQGIFFDAMQFFNDKEGIAIGDPLAHQFTVIRTHNGGRSWEPDPISTLPDANEGEAIFAASGTSVVALPGNNVYFATGGSVARLFKSSSRKHNDSQQQSNKQTLKNGNNWQAYTIPVVQGSATRGVFSIAFLDTRQGIAVGGDYKQDTARAGNCMITTNGGRNWFAPVTPPGGYKSCVAWINNSHLVATGTSGTDISIDGGMNWQKIGNGFNVAVKARKGHRVFLAGKNIAVLDPEHKGPATHGVNTGLLEEK
ncbi:WD40/YVTN/BNR-like repeat-containing protein [Chitinophaga arvensicola]|uniref:Photosynthesis system II assembly factor Ycf48/Hcf136-like domain-containing protein n=1 Tax=Chitinophaga arvensicola TaxID=29529 RepID=A0A1I0RKV0_9BACT|nr:hypothetical protein [Chitinophaga arvensicola]SEW41742.1 Uncharacterized protein SAMN04488122_3020 [Chitinophaga arvensicola]